jgi:hypothetical protein
MAIASPEIIATELAAFLQRPNRTNRSARTHEVLASVLRTIHQRRLDASHVFAGLLCAQTPITALALPSHPQ